MPSASFPDSCNYYRYFDRSCSQEIRDIIPAPLRCVRNTKSSTHSQPCQASLPNPEHLSQKLSLITRTCSSREILLSFNPEAYSLPSFKSNVNKSDLTPSPLSHSLSFFLSFFFSNKLHQYSLQNSMLLFLFQMGYS